MKLRVIGPPRRGNTGDGEGWLVRCMGVRVVGMGREGGEVLTRQITGALTSVWRLPLVGYECKSQRVYSKKGEGGSD